MTGTEFDMTDAREAAILEMLASEGIVLWRGDLPWSSGDTTELNVVGVVAGDDGPDLFQASAWVSHGRYMNVREHLRAPLDRALARFLPAEGDGEAVARVLHHRGEDAAAAVAFPAQPRYLGRNANNASAVFTLRVPASAAGGQELAVAVTTCQPGGEFRCDVPFRMDFAELREWAAETFGSAAPRP